ncbi:hypothetical protein FGSG_08154 [Fusarium graminearum PH-1]|uniref:Chromosome 2, complete genome n=1 Tax=Gibberella zeae (strain ATCC MYA-4620 / CBS 123657 / FGSC 9075 / NRRL 31084 / PH-1) TaxID=229533 RepID=I1RV89_GIBZE|nr:hypothetical protein FGSG_08154 [Fusarium graminearum PH-1]ESU15234.1 hypothetical protein FGSG_08154 [Fusarium graminearum PH-1]CEF76424.1 unnamed protein product [Fusarium graminearum]|eukprot:XP_011320659.1 hypothetical protein FGSG_08154 [Fusarium graminearum PH-1]
MNTSSLQNAFEAQMTKAYCPDAPTPGYLWDPILHVWRSLDSEKALHCGYMAIVPDVELNDRLPWWNWNNLSQSVEYWRTYGRYAKRSQILGLIEYIRYDHAYEILNEGYDEDDGIEDTRPEAAEALLLEVIARSEEDGDDDFGTDNGDSDDDDYEYDYESDYD